MKKIFSLSFLLLLNSLLFSQLPGTNDATFNPTDDGSFGNGDNANSYINCSVIQPDGKIIIGGEFTTYGGVSSSLIARLNPNGSLDTSFHVGSGFTGLSGAKVNCITIQSDGKILVGGSFTYYNGVPLLRFARLNANGSLDLTFSAGSISGAGSYVSSIVQQPDGKIFVAGDFTAYNGNLRNRIVRVNADGSIDPTFVLTSGFNDYITSIVLQPDGKLVVVGNFTTYNGSARSRIARIQPNGSLDLLFFPGTGFNGAVNCISLLPNGKLVAGGSFTSFNNVSRAKIILLNNDCSLDAGFDPGAGFNNEIFTLLSLPGGKIIAGGNFTSYNGTVSGVNKLIKLDSLGNRDTSFNIGTGSSYAGSVLTTSLQADGKIIIGGSFSSFNEYSNKRVTRLQANGNLDFSFYSGTGFSSSTGKLLVLPDNRMLISGGGDKYNGVPIGVLTRLLPDGNLDTTFHVPSIPPSTIGNMYLQPDGKILILGNFTTIDGLSFPRIARLHPDGFLDPTFNPGTGFISGSSVRCVRMQSNGKIIIAGSFTTYNGVSCNNICRLNSDGSFDYTFNIGNAFNGLVSSLAIQSDDKMILGGAFTAFNGIARNKIIRLNADGTIDPSFDPGSGFNNEVYNLEIQPDGKPIVVGTFNTYNSINKSYIVRLQTDGSIDLTFQGSGFSGNLASAIAIQPDGKIIVTGIFSQYNGIPRKQIVRILPNGNVDQTFNPSPTFVNINNPVATIAFQGSDKLIMTGSFTNYNGVWRNCIARIFAGDCTQSYTTLNVSACNSYTLNHQTYNSSGVYTQNFYNSIMCDSIITLNLTINNPSSYSITDSFCDTYTLNGHTYNASGIYTQHLMNVAGCDSTITLNLTKNSNQLSINASACNIYTWNSITYNNSGIYSQTFTNIAGCDSVVTLNLTINSDRSSVKNVSSCYSYSLNGQTYTTSGTYSQSLNTVAGCDSLITLHLTIHQNTASNITATACSSYSLNNQTYNATGTYLQTRSNSVGCDSIIALHLTIIGEVVLSQSWNVLTAPSGGTYQWVNCQTGSIIPNETGQSFTVTTPGSYAVQYTQGACVDISPCITYTTVGIDEASFAGQVSVFPNPSSGYFTVNTGNITDNISIEILNLFGEKIPFSRVNNQGSVNLEISGAAGIYFISISSNGNKAILKLVKQ